MKYFVATLVTIWFIAAVYLYLNYAVFFKTFGVKKTKQKSELTDFERVNIVSDDEIILSGRLYTPQSGDSNKSVILSHRFKSNSEKDFKKEIAFYQKHGFNILVVDNRAHLNSGGKISTYGVSESYDLVCWSKWLELRFGTGCVILLHGKEMGGFAVLGAGANSQLPQNVVALIVSGIYESVFSEFSKVAVNKYGKFSKIIIPTVNMFCRLFAGFDMRDFNMKKLCKKVKLPVLFQKENDKDIVNNTPIKCTDKTLLEFLKQGGLI